MITTIFLLPFCHVLTLRNLICVVCLLIYVLFHALLEAISFFVRLIQNLPFAFYV